MGTVGIISLSLLLGMFILALLATSIALILLIFQARKQVLAWVSDFNRSISDLRDLIKQSNGDDLKLAVEKFEVGIRTMTRCVNRIELAALAIGDMAKTFVSETELASRGLPPEAYAEPDSEGAHYITQSEVAKRDAGTLEDM